MKNVFRTGAQFSMVGCVALALSACGGGGDGSGASAFSRGSQIVANTYDVVTLAGSGTQGDVNGVGTSAMFNSPAALLVDESGNVLVADSGNQLIRKITPSQEVSTLAGNSGIAGYADGDAASALFNNPTGLTTDTQGNLLVADTNNSQIRSITPQGGVTTRATRINIDQPVSLFPNGPQGLARDATGQIYLADTNSNAIKVVATDYAISQLAGSGQAGFQDCNAGSCAQFAQPRSVALDSKGNVYVADTGNQRIRKITPAGVVSTLAGSGSAGYADGAGTAAMFNSPVGIVVDSQDVVYVADQNNHVIRSITPAGVVSTVAGRQDAAGNADGVRAFATFNSPTGLAIDKDGNLYVSDVLNHNIRKLIRK